MKFVSKLLRKFAEPIHSSPGWDISNELDTVTTQFEFSKKQKTKSPQCSAKHHWECKGYFRPSSARTTGKYEAMTCECNCHKVLDLDPNL